MREPEHQPANLAENNLKPYQGLKHNHPADAPKGVSGRKQPKTLSGIETNFPSTSTHTAPGRSRKQPKTLSGIETERISAGVMISPLAENNLKPYQGLKQAATCKKQKLSAARRKQPKTLSGIETNSALAAFWVVSALGRKQPKTLSGIET